MDPTTAKILVHGAVSIAGMAILAWYEVNRKWNKDELQLTGLAMLWIPIVRYRVALIVAGICIPGSWELLANLFNFTSSQGG